MIELVEVTKRYRKNRGIENISFTLEPGKIVALVGANGAGKSTLIKLLTGQNKLDGGEINGLTENMLRYMPDDLTFPDTLTANEILSLLGHLKSIPKEQLMNVLQKVGLTDARQLKVSQYSKGMRQRLNLAQSLLGDGSLFVLDEPTNGLDPFWIATLKKMLVHEREQGQMVLFSTHLLSFAEEIADEVVMIHEGELLEKGQIAQLLVEHRCDNLEQLWLRLTNKEQLL